MWADIGFFVGGLLAGGLIGFEVSRRVNTSYTYRHSLTVGMRMIGQVSPNVATVEIRLALAGNGDISLDESRTQPRRPRIDLGHGLKFTKYRQYYNGENVVRGALWNYGSSLWINVHFLRAGSGTVMHVGVKGDLFRLRMDNLTFHQGRIPNVDIYCEGLLRGCPIVSD